jgi:hypothetical protein
MSGTGRKTVVAQADAASPQPSRPTDRFPWKGMSAREILHRTVRDLVSAEAESGLYTYTHVRRWTADPATGTAAVTQDVQVWRAADGSGSRATALVPADSADPLAAVQPTTSAILFGQGGLPLTLGTPAATTANLAGQFAYYGGQLQLRLPEMVAIMNTQACLTSQQRAAVLQILADTDGLMFLGWVDDRTGRTGVAFSLTSTDSQGAAVRDILIFDESTGVLLSYEQQHAQVFTKSQTQPAMVMSYVHYLKCGYTELQGQKP